MRIAYVVITFTNGLKGQKIEEFINNNLEDVGLMKVEGNQAVLSWELGEQDDLHDIDEDLYYVLKEESVGEHISFVP